MITAENITDEQIRELHTKLLDEDIRNIQGPDVREVKIALGLVCGMRQWRVEQAREHCSILLNARTERTP